MVRFSQLRQFSVSRPCASFGAKPRDLPAKFARHVARTVLAINRPRTGFSSPWREFGESGSFSLKSPAKRPQNPPFAAFRFLGGFRGFFAVSRLFRFSGFRGFSESCFL